MKKLVVVALLVAAIVALLRTKMIERDENFYAANDYFVELCGRDAGCSDRLIRLRPCFSGAYRQSIKPGADTVDVDSLVSCLNGKHPVPKLTAATSAELPFPTTR